MSGVVEKSDRELDAEVAERIMGWECGAMLATDDPKTPTAYTLPHYSTDIRFAFKVVEKMRQKGFVWIAKTPHGTGWQIQCCHQSSSNRGKIFRGLLPKAICLAALAAIEDE